MGKVEEKDTNTERRRRRGYAEEIQKKPNCVLVFFASSASLWLFLLRPVFVFKGTLLLYFVAAAVTSFFCASATLILSSFQ
jgi:hypothetical protein